MLGLEVELDVVDADGVLVTLDEDVRLAVEDGDEVKVCDSLGV